MLKRTHRVIGVILGLILVFLPLLHNDAYANGYFYTIKKGDTLWKISDAHDISITTIKKENNYWRNDIYPGQKLYMNKFRKLTDYERYLVAKAVYAEARGEVFEGQVAVASVILNRVMSTDFPNSIYGVIYQPYAFTAVKDGQINLEPKVEAYRAVDLAVDGWDPSFGAIYYFNPRTATSDWIWTREKIVEIGNHIFAK